MRAPDAISPRDCILGPPSNRDARHRGRKVLAFPPAFDTMAGGIALFRHRVLRSIELLLDPGAISGLATWPLFSRTSYQLVKRLAAKGVSPRTVLGVGANVGQFAVATAMLMPAAIIHSFE